MTRLLHAVVLALSTLFFPGCTPPRPTHAPQRDATPPDRAAILAASDLPALQPEPLFNDPMGVTVHRLTNGMTVYFSVDRERSNFTAWIATRAGSRNDPADSTGLAHYLEHMLFKGTERLGTLDFAAEKVHIDRIEALYAELHEVEDPKARAALFAEIDAETQATVTTAIPNEIGRIYSRLGIDDVNAATTADSTEYTSVVPASRLEQWAQVEADRFQNPVFRLFYPELEAVYEEKNMALDSPEDRMWEATDRLLFPGHPYGTQSTIGSVEHLKNPAYSDMVEFFHRWYVPNNMAVILVGNVDPDHALSVLEQHFGGWPPQPLPAPSAADLRAPHGRVVADVIAEGEEAVWATWRTVHPNHDDTPALEALDRLVGGSATGLLNVELVMPQKVLDASPVGDELREAGYWGMAATARGGQTLEEVESHLQAIVGKLQRGEFTEDDLAANVLQSEIADKYLAESGEVQAQMLLDSFVFRTPWSNAITGTDRLRAVTKADVVRVAKTYLGPDRVIVRRRRGEYAPPSIPKPATTPIPVDRDRTSPFARALLGQEAAPRAPMWLREDEHYRRRTSAAGPVIAAENQQSDLFSINYIFDVGHRERPLLCHALELLKLSGAEDLDATALQRRLFQLGTTIYTSCDDEQATIGVDGIDRNLDASLALVEGWLRHPRFTDETVATLLQSALSRRRTNLQDAEFVGSALAAFAAFGKRSPYLAAPSNKALARASGRRLARELRTLATLERSTLYFGPREADAVAGLAPLAGKHRPAARHAPLTYRDPDTPTLFFVHKAVAQTNVQIAIPLPPLSVNERPYVSLYNTMLGSGMSGLILQEVREARALAYSATGYFAPGPRPGDAAAIMGTLATQGDKTVGALGLMLDLLRTTPISEARFSAAKVSLAERYRAVYIEPRMRPRVVYNWGLQGDASDPRPPVFQAIGALDIATLREFVGRAATAPLAIGVVGDRERIDFEGLRRLATIEEVTVEDLVSYGP